MDKEWLVRVGAAIITTALVAFTAWVVFTILFDPSPAPCIQLGGC